MMQSKVRADNSPLRWLSHVLRTYLPIQLKMRLASLRLRGPLAVGKGSHLARGVHIIGRAHVRIGANSCIGARGWLNVNDRRAGEVGIVIGDNCFIGRDNFFVSGRRIDIGDYCLTATSCRFICSTHIVNNPQLPVVTTGTTTTDIITVGANCFFGAGTTVLGTVNIGHGSVIGAQALVLSDIPPFSIAVGNPARVVKRYSFRRAAWIAVGALGPDDLSENPGPDEYLEQLRRSTPIVPLPWLAAGAEMGSF